MQQYNYKVAPLCTSDHKPVSAVFGAKVKAVNKQKQHAVIAELTKSANIDQSHIKPLEEALLVDLTGTAKPLGTNYTHTHTHNITTRTYSVMCIRTTYCAYLFRID